MTELPHPPIKVAVCPRCDREVADGSTCDEAPWRTDDRELPPIRYGSESVKSEAEFCHDCGAAPGATHHYGCDVEECPHANQAISCDECVPLEHDPYERPVRVN